MSEPDAARKLRDLRAAREAAEEFALVRNLLGLSVAECREAGTALHTRSSRRDDGSLDARTLTRLTRVAIEKRRRSSRPDATQGRSRPAGQRAVVRPSLPVDIAALWQGAWNLGVVAHTSHGDLRRLFRTHGLTYADVRGARRCAARKVLMAWLAEKAGVRWRDGSPAIEAICLAQWVRLRQLLGCPVDDGERPNLEALVRAIVGRTPMGPPPGPAEWARASDGLGRALRLVKRRGARGTAARSAGVHDKIEPR